MHNTFRAILAMTTFLVTGALSSCNHTDELEPESPAPQIVFLFSPGGLGDMSYNDRILEGVQRFKMENGDIDIYIYSPESLQEAEKIFADWLVAPRYVNDFSSLVNGMRPQAMIFEKEYYETSGY
jgi:basic membrane lipoprotein Med (substrate-binding protein (PBP1-ABC) superfamily)